MQQDDAENEPLPEPAPPRADVAPERPAGPLPEPPSAMQQAVLDSGATPVEGNRFAFQTNEGTVFIASPADMARDKMFDAVSDAKWSRSYKPSDAEIDRMMFEDRDK